MVPEYHRYEDKFAPLFWVWRRFGKQLATQKLGFIRFGKIWTNSQNLRSIILEGDMEAFLNSRNSRPPATDAPTHSEHCHSG